MTARGALTAGVLNIDAAVVSQEIGSAIREQVLDQLQRKGAVLGLSGGIESSVSAALCVGALGKDQVFGLFMPEADSSPDSVRLGRLLAQYLGIRAQVEDINPILRAAGCFRRRDEAIRSVVPEFGERYKHKIVLANVPEGPTSATYAVVVQSPTGVTTRAYLTPEAYLGVVAATNFRQRTRKMIEYYYADRFQYAVVGTANRLEYDLGLFVKNGDGVADLKPLAHLYKTQVYQLAKYLGIPGEIQQRRPQEEFYFSLPYEKMDLCLYGRDHEIPPAEVALAVGLTTSQVERMYHLIDSKRSSSRYLHLAPLLVKAA